MYYHKRQACNIMAGRPASTAANPGNPTESDQGSKIENPVKSNAA
jgi:hypothetical protein